MMKRLERITIVHNTSVIGNSLYAPTTIAMDETQISVVL